MKRLALRREIGDTPRMAAPAPRRFPFLDALRGVALIAMVVNHTARWWMDGRMTWPRYHLIYLSMAIAAPIFLFLVGFCVPLGAGRRESGRFVRSLKRGLGLVVAGMALNFFLFPASPAFAGGVLETIGLSVILLAPLAGVLHRPAARWGALALAAGLYGAFALAFPSLVQWGAAHPGAADVLFFEYPLWPWFSIVLLGAALGWLWFDRVRRELPEAPFFGALAVAALAGLGLWLVLETWLGAPPYLSFKRDFSLNHFWTPAPASTLWVLGTTLALAAATWAAVERLGWRPAWLLTLGRHALFLYVAHQVVVVTFVREVFGLRFNAWWAFVLANLVLLAGLVLVARAWERIRPRVRRGASAAAVPASAVSG